jgi:hypothetical protein
MILLKLKGACPKKLEATRQRAPWTRIKRVNPLLMRAPEYQPAVPFRLDTYTDRYKTAQAKLVGMQLDPAFLRAG